MAQPTRRSAAPGDPRRFAALSVVARAAVDTGGVDARVRGRLAAAVGAMAQCVPEPHRAPIYAICFRARRAKQPGVGPRRQSRGLRGAAEGHGPVSGLCALSGFTAGHPDHPPCRGRYSNQLDRDRNDRIPINTAAGRTLVGLACGRRSTAISGLWRRQSDRHQRPLRRQCPGTARPWHGCIKADDGLIGLWISSPPGSAPKRYEPAPFAARFSVERPHGEVLAGRHADPPACGTRAPARKRG